MNIAIWESMVLPLLKTHAGFTTGDIAAKVHPKFSSSNRKHAAFIRSVLLGMEKRRVVCRLDDLKPVCWCKTPQPTQPPAQSAGKGE